MKHPAEMDLHDADRLRIEELEQQVLTLTFDLETARNLLAECEEAAATPRCDYGNHSPGD